MSTFPVRLTAALFAAALLWIPTIQSPATAASVVLYSLA